MLFVLPFLVMAIAFLSGYFSLESLQSVQVKGVINMAYINQLDKSWLSAIGFVMVLGVAYCWDKRRPCLHLFISC